MVTFLPITSDLEFAIAVRIPVAANASNGLRRDSQVMVDRIQTSSLSRIGGIVGYLNDETMQAVENALLIHLGLI